VRSSSRSSAHLCRGPGAKRNPDECHVHRFEQYSDVVTARFADGQSESGDLLLGAHGIQSAIRAQLFGPSEPRYAGYTCWRGLAHFEHPDLPSGLSLFAVGRGTQMGLSHCGPGRIYWFVTQNAPAGTADPRAGTNTRFSQLSRDGIPCSALSSRRPMSRPS
jgi:2-polyprenyl-6-methoxyphenol hydroxylase-like FAD-dependent oxidoreductase